MVMVPGCGHDGHARFPNSGEKWTQPRFIQRDRQGIAWLAKWFWKALTLI
jgi:hypothetical protein